MIKRSNGNPGDRERDKSGSDLNRLYFRSLLDSSNTIIIRAIDREYRYLFFNNAYKTNMKRIYGADVTEGKSIFDGTFLGDDKELIKKVYDRVFAGESFSTVNRDAVTGHFYYENHFYPLTDDEGHITGAVSFGIDISERKRAEAALEQSEGLFKTLFMSLTDGLYLSEIIFDEKGVPCDYCYLEVNPRFETITGLTRENLIGRKYTEVVPADTTQWLENYLHVAKSGEPATYEFYSSEYKKHFETYACKTEATRIAVFVRDVTERRRTERALLNVQKLESLGILAGGIAHDFNNILCGLFGHIELAKLSLSSNDPVDVEEKLTQAMQTLDTLRGLTGQLLTFSKGGKPQSRVESLDPLIRNCCALALSGSRIKCEIDIDPGLSLCLCDRNQIAQVLTNLIINAKQAMMSGGKINVSAGNETFGENQNVLLPAGGSFVRISVKDHGAGIPGEVLKNIFDPFYTTKETGHGLGLSSAWSIVQRHKGSIEVESNPSEGTTFHVYLPAETDAGAAIHEEEGASYRGRGPVLIMDDEADIRGVIREMIERLGHSVVEAANGEEALSLFNKAQLENSPFVMTILDLTVKDGSGGLETMLEIRKFTPDAVIVAASGYANDLIMSKPQSSGFNGSITKPFTMKEISDLFMQIFRIGD